MSAPKTAGSRRHTAGAIARLRASVSGNVAIMGALLAPVFVMTTALAVDTARVQTANRNLQQSLDAAALAGAKEYGRNPAPADVEKAARAFFVTNLDGDAASTELTYNGVIYENGNLVLKVSAVRNEPTIFGPALKAITGGTWKRDTWTVNAASEVIIENRSVELVLVLDNSGSMDWVPGGGGSRKIVTLREASVKLVQQLLAPRTDTNIQNPVKVGLVPFSGAVNVGTDKRNASWMDTTGRNPDHHADLDWSAWRLLGIPQATPLPDGRWLRTGTLSYLTRFSLFDALERRSSSFKWRGCVDSRPNGLAITDTAPSNANPSSLFVPLFAPSEPDTSRSGASPTVNMYLTESSPSTWDQAASLQRDVTKYMDSGRRLSGSGNPNDQCNTTPITALTADQRTLETAINAMQPLGATNIPEGLAWGWRVLSPGEPFTEGRAKDADDNLKVMVLMTDGENTYYPSYSNGTPAEYYNHNRSMFGTYGYAQVREGNNSVYGRIFDAAPQTAKSFQGRSYQTAMNEMTAAACENAKADGRRPDGSDGIVIFTIAFDLPDGTPVKKLMENCASNGVNGKGVKLYYDAKNSDDLLAAFGSITEEISSLRISR